MAVKIILSKTELENIYDNHFDDIIDFIHEVRDINDLNALPGLLLADFICWRKNINFKNDNKSININKNEMPTMITIIINGTYMQ